MSLKKILAPVLWIAVTACSTPPPAIQLENSAHLLPVYVIAHDDHTGIAIRRADIPAGLWPESSDFPRADFLEVGWGARDYYMGRDQGFFGTLKAALGMTRSVLHVAGFAGAPANFFRGSEVVELRVSPEGLAQIVRAVHDAHERTGAAAVASLGPGLYGDSRFYPAWEHFSLLNTCNVWSARVLRAGGLPVEDAITKEGLMSQVRDLARRPAPALPSEPLRAPS